MAGSGAADWPLVAAVAAGVTTALAFAPLRLSPPSLEPVAPTVRPAASARRWHVPLGLLAGVGAALFIGGVAGLALGPVVAVVAVIVLRRAEDPAERRARAAAEAELPHLVLLLAAALRAGAPPATAIAVVSQALPGPASARLDGVRARLALGLDPVDVWAVLVDDQVLGPLARGMTRAARSGTPVADAVDRLSDDLTAQARARREERARTVGVRAALPLGGCLLPAFLLVGIVPLVAGLFGALLR